MAAAPLRLAASISCKCLPAKPLLAATLECYNCDAHHAGDERQENLAQQHDDREHCREYRNSEHD
jgi:hypothetical protein